MTEAMIRAAVLQQLPLPAVPLKIAHVIDVPEWMTETAEVISGSDMASRRAVWHEGCTPLEDHPGIRWADLTEEESDELHEAVEDVHRRVLAASVRMLIEELVGLGVAFAEAHPDAPRGHWKAREAVPA